MKFFAASTFSLVALEITSSFPFSIIQIVDYKPIPIHSNSNPHYSLNSYSLPKETTQLLLFYNNMTQIIIPANTNNSISKVAEFQFGSSRSVLYIGSIQAASDPFTLKQYKIASVLTVASEILVKPGVGIAHKVIGVQDNPFEDLYQYISDANDFISTQLAKGNVLVHCRAGISRSATIVLAFLMKTKKWMMRRALEFLRACRPIVKPNEGFMQQLKKYERKLAKALEQKQLKLK